MSEQQPVPAPDPAPDPAPAPAPTDPAPAPAPEPKPADPALPIAAKAPEQYEAFKLPEGVTFDEKLSTDLTGLAKKFDLPQDRAQELADYTLNVAKAYHDESTAAFEKTVGEWVSQAKADKEIGGEQFSENLGIAKAALDKFGGKELLAFLEETKLGNHPALVKAFWKIGKAISQDTVTQRTAGEGAPAGASALSNAPQVYWGDSMKGLTRTQ